MDGTPTLRMNEFVVSSVALGKVDHGNPIVRPDLPAPEALRFELDTITKEQIAKAEKDYTELTDSHALQVLHYEAYGASYIKSHDISPDAWTQLIKQLAFYKMFGRPPVVYESVQTRKFQLGRTEVLKSTSNESKAWCEAMQSNTSTDTHRTKLFRQAATRHVQSSSWAGSGQGVVRHLSGLKKLLREGEDLPEIYTDAAFGKTTHWELSTSQLSSPWFDAWGYGEVVPDGFGLAYAIGNDYLRWTITSVRKDGPELKHHLAEAASEVRHMMEAATKAETEKAKL